MRVVKLPEAKKGFVLFAILMLPKAAMLLGAGQSS